MFADLEGDRLLLGEKAFIDPLEGRWIRQARCRGHYGIFFIDRYSNQRNYDKARNLCRICPVKSECLSYVLQNCDEEGFWSGLTPAERADLKREGSLLKVDWSNPMEIKQFRRQWEHYRRLGDAIHIDWKDKSQVTAFRLTYSYSFQPSLFNGTDPYPEREE